MARLGAGGWEPLDGSPPGEVDDIHVTRDGDVWIVSEGRPWRYREAVGEWQELAVDSVGLHIARREATVMADGTVWVCPNTRGLRSLGSLANEPFSTIWARRPTQHVGGDCRIACRNHELNRTLDYICSERLHAEFV